MVAQLRVWFCGRTAIPAIGLAPPRVVVINVRLFLRHVAPCSLLNVTFPDPCPGLVRMWLTVLLTVWPLTNRVLVWVYSRVVLPSMPVRLVLAKFGACMVITRRLMLGMNGPFPVRISRTVLWFLRLGVVMFIRWLNWFGCSRVGLSMLGWPAVVTTTRPALPLKLLTLMSSRPSARLCLLRLLFTLELCPWFMVLTLLTKTTVGVPPPVLLNRLCIWEVLRFMNTLMKLELVTEQNGMLVLFVTVWVSNAPLALGGLHSSILCGTCVFSVPHPDGLPRKLPTLLILVMVLLLLVILVNPAAGARLLSSPLSPPSLFTLSTLLVLFTWSTSY